MKCPLQILKTGMIENIEQIDFYPCIREECAWWSPIDAMCAITVLAKDAPLFINLMGSIRDKIPPHIPKH